MNDTTLALLTALDDVASATARPGLSGQERLARAGVVRDAQADLAALTAADPYTTGAHSLLADAMVVGRTRHGETVPADVTDRLALHANAVALRAAIQNQVLSDTPGLSPATPTGLPYLPGLPGAPFLALATLFTPTGTSVDLPAAWTRGTGAIDPAEKTEIVATVSTMDTVTTPVHWAGYGANVSRQILDWAVDAQRRIEEVFADICNTTLEAALIADLLTAAGTPAADLDTAEATAGTAWGSTVDTIIVNPGDWPAVRRTYAPQPVPFGNVCVTASIAAGTALVLPLGGVWLLAERMQLLSQVEPSRLGSAIVATRGGVVAERRTGVVAAATLATVNP